MSFPHLLTDLREAWQAVSFARPEWLGIVALLPLLVLLGWWASRRRAARLASLGQPAALFALSTPVVWGQGFSAIAFPLAGLLLIVGFAGPRWGKSDEAGIAVGRDLVIVLDLSRSMLADDMNGPVSTRVEAARLAAIDLLDSVARRGGHRVGVVIFAAKPVALTPLTTDYDHARSTLESLNVKQPPLACRPGLDPSAVSGTRIGAALTMAVEMHDSRFRGSQDIVLLSDGDDPVDDREYRRGIDSARTANIPVHPVGLGSAERESTIAIGDALLDFLPADGQAPETVRTRLREEPLREIAQETRGQYVPTRQTPPALGDFYRSQIEPHPSRRFSDDEIPQPKERYVWFLAGSLLLFTGHWIRGE